MRYQQIDQENIQILLKVIKNDINHSNDDMLFTNVHLKLKDEKDSFNGDALCIKLPFDIGIRERKVTLIIDANVNQLIQDEIVV